MSEAAKIILTGKPSKELKDEIKRIKEWDAGYSYPIRVSIDGKNFKDDSIKNVEKAINGDLEDYILKNFVGKGEFLKTGGNDDFHVVKDMEVKATSTPVEKSFNNMTPKKKKRKKTKKTHRR